MVVKVMRYGRETVSLVREILKVLTSVIQPVCPSEQIVNNIMPNQINSRRDARIQTQA